MAQAAKQLTREQELRAAISKAFLPPRDYRIFMALFDRAEWGTAAIRDRFQPRSLKELAEWSRMSLANVKRGVGHLGRHGWIERHRHVSENGIGGRGHPTRYVLSNGQDCDCKPAQSEPVSSRKAAQIEPRNRLRTCDVSAGQPPVPAKSVRDEGRVGEGSPKAEYQGGPVPWVPAPPSPSVPALPLVPLMLTIGDRTQPAIVCRGCGELCWTHISFDGCHATCAPPQYLHPSKEKPCPPS
jgi:hypothetical protein